MVSSFNSASIYKNVLTWMVQSKKKHHDWKNNMFFSSVWRDVGVRPLTQRFLWFPDVPEFNAKLNLHLVQILDAHFVLIYVDTKFEKYYFKPILKNQKVDRVAHFRILHRYTQCNVIVTLFELHFYFNILKNVIDLKN